MSETQISDMQHYLQSRQWQELREGAGWSVGHTKNIAYYYKNTPVGSMVYVPGASTVTDDLLSSLKGELSNGNNFVCKLEACAPYDPGIEAVFTRNGWKKAHNVQYDHTVMLDLTKSEEQLMQEMKKRSRNEIRRAIKEGVSVEQVEPSDENLEKMFTLLATTSQRKKFTIRDRDFTLAFWRAFRKSNKLRLFFAKHEGDLVACGTVIVDESGSFAWYKDGASDMKQSYLFAPRLMLWEAAKALKSEGVKTFDLGGVPNPAAYEQSSMKGIYIFKTGYAQEVTAMMPAYELPLKPFMYRLWPLIEKSYKQLKRLKKFG